MTLSHLDIFTSNAQGAYIHMYLHNTIMICIKHCIGQGKDPNKIIPCSCDYMRKTDHLPIIIMLWINVLVYYQICSFRVAVEYCNIEINWNICW